MRKLSFVLFLLFLLAMLLSSCTEKYPAVNEGDIARSTGSGCVDCHTNKDLLKEVATPIDPGDGGDSGEG